LNTSHKTPRRACGLEARIRGPPVVAQNLDVRICVGCVHIPESKLVGDDGDVRGATQLAERRRADLQGNAVGQLQRVCGSARDQLLQDRTAFEASLRVVQDDLRHPLIERDTEQDTALARHQRIAVIAEPRDVGGECRHCPGLATSSTNHGCELVDTLPRLALAAGQLAENLALVPTEGFAHCRNQECAPRHPTVTCDRGAEQVWV
jgi:hypothetical protein